MKLIEILKKYVIPYEKHRYSTSLSAQEFREALKAVVEPKQFIRFYGIFASSNSKDYEGNVNLNDFKIQKLSKKKKSNTPVVEGKITSSLTNKTAVQLTLRPQYFTVFFFAIWLFLFFGSTTAFNFSVDFSNKIYVPLLFITIGIVFFIGTFKYEANKSRKYLERLLKLETSNDTANSWITRN